MTEPLAGTRPEEDRPPDHDEGRTVADYPPPVTIRERWHGTAFGWRRKGCTCDPCWEAREADPTIRQRALRAQEAMRPRPPARGSSCGTRGSYNEGCRCRLCREAERVYRVRYRKAKAAA